MKSFVAPCRIVCAMVACMTISSAAVAQQPQQDSDRSVQQLVAAEQKFSQALYAKLAATDTDNIVIAPFGVFESLALLDVGARGNSSAMIRRVTGLPASGAAVASSIMQLHRSGAAKVGSLDAAVRDNDGYGVMIAETPHDDSLAARARLDKGDLIFSVDGAVVRTVTDLQNMFRSAGDRATLTGYDFSNGSVFLNRRVGVAKSVEESDSPADRQIIFASMLWLRSDVAAGSLFPTVLHDLYQIPTLSHETFNPVKVQDAVNEAFQERTAGRVTDVPLPHDLNPLTALLLMNTITMDARWQSRFPIEATKVAGFETDGEHTIPVSYMRQTGVFRYAEIGDVQILELPYRESDLVMRVSLAKDIDAQNRFEEAGFLNPVDAHRLSELLQPARVDLALPKFRIEFATSLRSVLERLQLAELFANNADFSGVSTRIPIRLDDMLQSTFVEINEEGTRAGAVTTTVGIPKSAEDPRIVRFHATHPFHFEIRDAYGTVLFAGRVQRPTVAER